MMNLATSEDVLIGIAVEGVHLIMGFKVGRSTIVGMKATVPVEYENLGTTDSIELTPAILSKYTPNFELIKQKGVWKINEYREPHVHWKTIVAYLRNLKRDDPERNEQLETHIQAILKARDKYEGKK
jgi:hypothetical protein